VTDAVAPGTFGAARVGVIGGGQLGRMLALAGVPLGIQCVGLEPADNAPMAAVADVIAGAFDDRRALSKLMARVDVVTVELEHVDVDALAWVAERIPVRPGPDAIGAAQDRLAEKQLVRRCGLRTAPFGNEATLPAIVKTRRGGFDGRGQRRVGTPQQLDAAVAELTNPIVESVVDFRRELSIVAARALDGSIARYPLVENHHRDGILRLTLVPAPDLDEAITAEAAMIVDRLLQTLDFVGVLAVELFDTDAGLVVNEIAPRVHNSGHWTIDGAVTSQFEQHLRAVCGLPLGDPSAVGVSAMVNLIGTEPDRDAVLAIPGAHLHRYGKSARPGRKLGHITVTAPDPATRQERLDAVSVVVGQPVDTL
jgi:5-(carboxyamino)imidazole ribonucleotide synthase